MSKREYRSLYASLVWDLDFQGLSPDARLTFYTLKLLLGPSGLDGFPGGVAALVMPSGLPVGRLVPAVRELVDGGWVVVQEPVWWIRNGLKHDPHLTMGNPKHRTMIQNFLAGLPAVPLLNVFASYYGLELPAPELGDSVPPWEPPEWLAASVPAPQPQAPQEARNNAPPAPQVTPIPAQPKEGDVIALVKRHLYLHSKPEAGWSVGRDVTILRQLQKPEHGGFRLDQLADAVRGMGVLRRQGHPVLGRVPRDRGMDLRLVHGKKIRDEFSRKLILEAIDAWRADERRREEADPTKPVASILRGIIDGKGAAA